MPILELNLLPEIKNLPTMDDSRDASLVKRTKDRELCEPAVF